eukprot:5883015-Karenia_brevis.AAC.1
MECQTDFAACIKLNLLMDLKETVGSSRTSSGVSRGTSGTVSTESPGKIGSAGGHSRQSQREGME